MIDGDGGGFREVWLYIRVMIFLIFCRLLDVILWRGLVIFINKFFVKLVFIDNLDGGFVCNIGFIFVFEFRW